MDGTELILAGMTLAGAMAGNGLVQFLITRKDKKKEDAKNTELKELDKKITQDLIECEKASIARYDEHDAVIQEMNEHHRQDFLELRTAIQKLTENDSKITKSIESLTETQSAMAESLVGMAHDRIIQYTDKISERGCITNKEKSTLKSMYNPYHRLGGNGEVHEAYNYVLTLPTVSEEIAHDKDKALRCNELKECYTNQ